MEVLRQSQNQPPVQVVQLEKKAEMPKSEATMQELEQTYAVGVWIYACVNVIAEKSADIPFKVINSRNEKQPNPLPKKPNPLMDWTFLRQLNQIWLEETGNAYWLRDKNDTEFWPLRPSRVRVVPAADGRSIVGYAYQRGTGFVPNTSGSPSPNQRWYAKELNEPMYCSQSEFDSQVTKWYNWLKFGASYEEKLPVTDNWIPLPKDRVIHFRYPHPFSDYYGMSPLQPLLVSFITEMYARQWNRKFFENGALPPGVLVFPRVLPEAEFKRLEKMYKEQHGGIDNVWKPFIVQGGAEYIPFENQHKDLDFLNLLKQSATETLAVLNVPPVMVNIYDGLIGSTRSIGVREQRKSFYQDTVLPKQRMIAATLTDALGDKLGEDNSFDLDTDGIDALKPDFTELTTAGEKAIRSGFTVQEVRERIYDLPPQPADPIFLPIGLVPIQLEQPQQRPTAFMGAFQHGYYPMLSSAQFQCLPVVQNYMARSQTERESDTNESSKNHNSDDDEAERASAWQTVEKRFVRVENQLFDWLVDLFKGQEKRYIKAIKREYNRKAVLKAVFLEEGEEGKTLPEITTGLNNQSYDEWYIFVDAARLMFTEILGREGLKALKWVGIAGDFDLLNPSVLLYLDQKVFKFAREVHQTTVDALREALRIAIQNGESIDEITERIMKVFDGTVRGTAPRSRMIARTESTGIVNGGSRLAYQQHEDIVEGVEWLSSRDNRVRPSHTQADGQKVALDRPFVVGGALLRFPGDPAGPAQEVINCRCTILPTLIKEKP